MNWVISTFDLFTYASTEWFYKIWIVPTAIYYVSLLIFFITLSKKQKESNNG